MVRGFPEWFATFLDPYRNPGREEEDGKSLGIQRCWTLAAYLATGDDVLCTYDASPFGLGAFLLVSLAIVEHCSAVISAKDEHRFGHATGD